MDIKQTNKRKGNKMNIEKHAVDGWIPVYNYDLIEALSSDHTLANVDDTGLLPKNPSVHDIIRMAIYERLINVAYTWLSDNEKKEVA